MNLKGRNKVTPEFNMSSMTDIVFLLLIFFMIASTLVSANAIDLLLPKASGKTANKKSISVSINKDLQFHVNMEQMDKEEIESKILEIFNAEDDASIVLRVEEGVPIENAVFVMDIANRNKIKSILAVRPN